MLSNNKNQIGRVLGGRFKVLELLGGGMGLIFIVEDLVIGRKGVIKTIKQNDRGLRKRFIEEVKALSLIRSQYVVETYKVLTGDSLFNDSEEIDSVLFDQHSESRKMLIDNYYLLMEYCNGGNLRSKMNSGQSRNLEDSLTYALQFVCGMIECERTIPGLVHRDIKPENILFHDNNLKISDFGLVRQSFPIGTFDENRAIATVEIPIKDMQTTLGSLVGTIPYMSPEQIEGKTELDCRSDIFSYGVVLYEFFAGLRPYDGNFATIKRGLLSKDFIRPLRKVKPDLDIRICKVIDRCLFKNPDDRPQSWKEVLEIWLEFIRVQMPDDTSFSNIPKHNLSIKNRLLFMELESRNRSYVDKGNDKRELARIGFKPLDSLRKAEDFYQLNQNEDALAIIDNALALPSRLNKQVMLDRLTLLLSKNKEEEIFTATTRDESGFLISQMNMSRFVEDFMILRGKCYSSLLDMVTQGGKRANATSTKEAVVNAEVLITLFPTNPMMLILAAQIYMLLDNFETAIWNVEKAGKLDPSSRLVPGMMKQVWTRKGMYYIQSEDFNQALLCFDKLIEIDSRDAGAWLNKGLVLSQRSNASEALSILKIAQKLGHPQAGQFISELQAGRSIEIRRTTEPKEDSIQDALDAFSQAKTLKEMIKVTEIYPFILDSDFLEKLKMLIDQSGDKGLMQRFNDLVRIPRSKGE